MVLLQVNAAVGLGVPGRATRRYNARAAKMVPTPAIEDVGRSMSECPTIQVESATKRSGVTG
jgi:hypothetical protein